MISPLSRSDASARAAVARSCAFSFVTASCSAADSSAVSVPPRARPLRVSRAAATNRSSANVSDARPARRRSPSARERVGARLRFISRTPRYQVEQRRPDRRGRDAAPSARKVPNGSAYFIVPRLATISRIADDVPDERRQHQRQQRQLPAEERADHRQHLHVAHAEAFLVPQR